MVRPSILLCVLQVMLLSACGPSARGSITPAGYAHSSYALELPRAASGELVAEGWVVDNFYRKGKNKGKEADFVPKKGADYLIDYKLDENGDGEYETTAREHAYALRFKHLRHDGNIFLRTIPISSDQQHKQLDVLMLRYVQEIAGAGYEVVQLTPGRQMLLEKRYAAVATDQGPASWAGYKAYYAKLEVANIDQLEMDRSARKRQVELVLMHTDFAYWPSNRQNRKKGGQFPVLLLAGHANHPGQFEKSQKDFHEFLSRVTIHGRRGFRIMQRKPMTGKDRRQQGAMQQSERAHDKNTEADRDSDDSEGPSEAEQSSAPATPDGSSKNAGSNEPGDGSGDADEADTTH